MPPEFAGEPESGRAVINSSTRRRGWRWQFTDGGEQGAGSSIATTTLTVNRHHQSFNAKNAVSIVEM